MKKAVFIVLFLVASVISGMIIKDIQEIEVSANTALPITTFEPFINHGEKTTFGYSWSWTEGGSNYSDEEIVNAYQFDLDIAVYDFNGGGADASEESHSAIGIETGEYFVMDVRMKNDSINPAKMSFLEVDFNGLDVDIIGYYKNTGTFDPVETTRRGIGFYPTTTGEIAANSEEHYYILLKAKNNLTSGAAAIITDVTFPSQDGSQEGVIYKGQGSIAIQKTDPDVKLDKTMPQLQVLLPEQEIEYTIIAENLGNADGGPTIIGDTLLEKIAAGQVQGIELIEQPHFETARNEFTNLNPYVTDTNTVTMNPDGTITVDKLEYGTIFSQQALLGELRGDAYEIRYKVKVTDVQAAYNSVGANLLNIAYIPGKEVITNITSIVDENTSLTQSTNIDPEYDETAVDNNLTYESGTAVPFATGEPILAKNLSDGSDYEVGNTIVDESVIPSPVSPENEMSVEALREYNYNLDVYTGAIPATITSFKVTDPIESRLIPDFSTIKVYEVTDYTYGTDGVLGTELIQGVDYTNNSSGSNLEIEFDNVVADPQGKAMTYYRIEFKVKVIDTISETQVSLIDNTAKLFVDNTEVAQSMVTTKIIPKVVEPPVLPPEPPTIKPPIVQPPTEPSKPIMVSPTNSPAVSPKIAKTGEYGSAVVVFIAFVLGIGYLIVKNFLKKHA